MRGRIPYFAVLLAACVGGDGGSDGEWRTQVSALGDTTLVTISGEIPEERVSRLLPDLRIGELEGEEEYTFGRVGIVYGLADGGMLVEDAGARIIRMYDSTGTFVRNLGRRGGGPGEYTQVNGIARHASGDLYVWDAGGSRINRYRPDGEFVTSFSSPLSGWYSQNQLHADDAGRIYIWSPLWRDPENAMNRKDGFIAMDSAGMVLDSLWYPEWPEESEPLQARSPNGSSMSMYSRPWAANSSTDLRRDGGLVSGAGLTYEFLILPNDGGPIKVQREYTPVPVGATEAAERRAIVEQGLRRTDPGWNWTGPGIPAVKPAYQQLDVAEDGRIWVRLFTPEERIPEAELPPERPAPAGGGPAPVRSTTREPLLYDVFTADGRLLGRVAPPPRVRLSRMSGDYAWGVMTDADGVEFAVRFRIEPGLTR